MTRVIRIFFMIMALFSLNANAAFITGGASGLSSPDSLLDFGNTLFPNGTFITNQFAASGVTFSTNNTDNWGYETHGADVDTQSQGHLQRQTVNEPFSVFSINFSAPVADALVNFRAFTGITWDMTSLLNGVFVETISFVSFSSSNPVSNSFYGFLNSNFNEIQLANNNADAGFEIDNLQFNLVPEPTTLSLIVLGLVGIGLSRRQLAH